MRTNRIFYAVSLMLGISGVMVLVALLLQFSPAIRNGILLGIVLSAINAILSFLSLYWSFQKSSGIFFTTWSAGILARLLVLAATAFLVFRNSSFDFLSTLLTLVFATMILMFLEFDFLPKRIS